ncbi:MAG: tRNA (adenosine(37)-N6)-dimethylallyltransferase MiaA [Cellvibrionales bacterium TMED49]|nr:tRNA (adenosine(37)-N6)-dimethylallyltransferase MiaA [Porticoccaceae bacterium]OUU39132.1 MAG: tRNA (adenosine(37)-N6)-dimethylallyltransferase MiaA [Cellvibrionales bacterium TMED49]
MGPTAIGKTDIALSIYQHFPVEIVSVDSAQVYRHLDIGTAKPSKAVLEEVPHWLIDVVDPTDVYNAARFVNDANQAIRRIWQKGKIPLLVGGSMMYFNVLINGLSDLPPACPKVRERLNRQIELEGVESLHDRLKRIDSDAASRVHPRQRQRVVRALEVFELTGTPLSELQAQKNTYDVTHLMEIYQIGLWPSDRTMLHRRIEQRFESMLNRGLCDEVQSLCARGDLNAEFPAIRAVGYRQIWGFLQGIYCLETAKNLTISASRQLAKRQLTWMRRWSDLDIVHVDPMSDREKLKKNILNRLKKHV